MRLAASAALVLLSLAQAHAENRVAVRGAYYREASTRVVQPVVELSKELPRGFDVSALYLLDAISSASVAAGVASDDVFTEYRSEVGLAVGKTFGRTRIGASYRYSAESDYWSHGFATSLSRRLWSDTGTIALALGRGRDTISGRPNVAGGCSASQGRGCLLDVTFGGLSYSQVLSPRFVAQVGYEVAYLNGYQGNPYRQVPPLGVEKVPAERLRHVATARLAHYVPRSRTGFQAHYRFYRDQYPGWAAAGYDEDPWRVASHTLEGRIYQSVGRDLELRLTYRWYSQGKATFFCDTTPNCYAVGTLAYASDPKLAALGTHFVEGKVVWEAARLQQVPLLGWFAPGSFEIAYGHVLQTTMFGNAHLLALGYSMPF